MGGSESALWPADNVVEVPIAEDVVVDDTPVDSETIASMITMALIEKQQLNKANYAFNMLSNNYDVCACSDKPVGVSSPCGYWVRPASINPL